MLGRIIVGSTLLAAGYVTDMVGAIVLKGEISSNMKPRTKKILKGVIAGSCFVTGSLSAFVGGATLTSVLVVK